MPGPGALWSAVELTKGHVLRIVLVARVQVFAFAAIGDQWIGWATITGMFAILVMVDFMFLDDGSFVFEPDIKVRSGMLWPLNGGGGAM